MSNEVVVLNGSEQSLINNAFSDAKDFRTVGERITAPIDSIINETTAIIEKDPIMKVSDELSDMNKQMQGVYESIMDTDGALMGFMKTVPGIGAIAKMIDRKFDELSFNMKDINGKIEAIFSGFDQSYESLNTSIDMQMNFLDGIEQNLGRVIAYKEYLSGKLEDFKKEQEITDEPSKLKMFTRSVEFFLTNLVVLIGNLEMAKKRLLIRMDSAQKLSLSMNSSKPIFKTLLSTAVIEISGQKAIDASMEAITAMGASIDKMSSQLTDKAIESNRKAEEISSKPILSTSIFVENVTKLKHHFDEIEDYREAVAIEAKKEREDFDNARKQLEDIKVLTKKESDELDAIMQQS